ncbi:hypothetical protein AA0472_2753 [Acetobacter estunensis NRIC 0472]|nr:hypothetical protein AA0472_2753 [Acetobacter estunensis NRIC 0472]
MAVGADFFILYDRTYGDDLPEDIRTHDRVFFVTNQDALDLGLSGTHDGRVNLFWYNADYQHSLFVLKYPDYDFFCFVESDVEGSKNPDFGSSRHNNINELSF